MIQSSSVQLFFIYLPVNSLTAKHKSNANKNGNEHAKSNIEKEQNQRKIIQYNPLIKKPILKGNNCILLKGI
jgi:hypothetical protein